MPAAYITLIYVIQIFLLLQNITIVNTAIVWLTRELLSMTYWKKHLPLNRFK